MKNLQPQIQKALAIVKALPGTPRFASEREEDEYPAAMQRKAAGRLDVPRKPRITAARPQGAGLLGISKAGEMVVPLDMGPPVNGFERIGTLARLPLATSVPLAEILARN